MNWSDGIVVVYILGAMASAVVAAGMLEDVMDEKTVFMVVFWPLTLLVVLVRGGSKFLRQ